MSAYVVEDKTINTILAWVEQAAWDSSNNWIFRPFNSIGYAIDRSHTDYLFYGELQRLAEALFQMNCNGVNARYGDGQAEQFRELNFEYKSIATPTIIQAIKSIECLSYQCCEGKIHETGLYKALEQVIHNCQGQVVQSLPEYESAKWGS